MLSVDDTELLFKDLNNWHFIRTQTSLNCSFFSSEQLQTWSQTNSQPEVGIFIFILGLITISMSIPTTVAMFFKDNFQYPVFKIMSLISIADSISLLITGVASGFLLINGIGPCDAPLTNLIFGGLYYGCFIFTSTSTILLLVTRIVEMSNSIYFAFILRTRFIYSYMIIAFIYAVCITLFTKPMTFSPVVISWNFNPFMGYLPENRQLMRNIVYIVHDAIFVSFSLLAYLTFAIFYIKKVSSLSQPTQSSSSMSVRLTLQILTISSIDTLVCVLCVSNNLMDLNKATHVIGHVTWILYAASPSIVIWTFNKSFRKTFMAKLFKPRIGPLITVYSK
uniref:Serpentine Receptor, class T n=1 Tax=Rhabditophanes sp. KR3021 TaxID=114890 RepID=A0AC35TQE1_9BILA